MQRRRLLHSIGASIGLGLAGCLGDESPAPGPGGDQTASPTSSDENTAQPAENSTATKTAAPGDTENTGTATETGIDSTETATATPDDEQTETPTATPDYAMNITDQSLEILESACGQQRDEASVTVDKSAHTVSVTGTVWGNDAGYTAALDEVRIDGGRLEVTVVAEEDPDSGMAAQCITEIEYRATVTFDGAPPGEIVVTHRHADETTTVTTASGSKDC